MPVHTLESPAKKQSKWSPEEDALIIELRGNNMKWDDISKHLPGRSSISCRLHYQNYLERRSEWDDERKNKLARLYERFKPEMWAKVAEEMQVPWRAAEAMHWQIGEHEMARRAGVVPFSLNFTPDEPQGPQRFSPTRGHAHSYSQGSLPRDFTGGLPSPRYTRGPPHPHTQPHPHPHAQTQGPPFIPPPTPRPLSSRRESLPPRHPFGPLISEHRFQQPQPTEYGYGLAPLQPVSLGSGRGSSNGSGTLLPSLAEITTGATSYSTPAYTLPQPHPAPPSNRSSPIPSSASPRLLPALPPYPQQQPQQQPQQHFETGGGGGGGGGGVGKRRASPLSEMGAVRETTRRRQHLSGDYPRGSSAEDTASPAPTPTSRIPVSAAYDAAYDVGGSAAGRGGYPHQHPHPHPHPPRSSGGNARSSTPPTTTAMRRSPEMGGSGRTGTSRVGARGVS